MGPSPGEDVLPVHHDHRPLPPREERDGPADHFRVAQHGAVPQSARRQELCAGPGAGDLFAVSIGNIGVVTVMHDQSRCGHTAGQRRYVQLLPSNLQPALQVPAHGVVGPEWNP